MHPELAFELIIAPRRFARTGVPQLHTTHIGLALSKLIRRGREAADIRLAEIAGSKREKSIASFAVGARSALDGTSAYI